MREVVSTPSRRPVRCRSRLRLVGIVSWFFHSTAPTAAGDRNIANLTKALPSVHVLMWPQPPLIPQHAVAETGERAPYAPSSTARNLAQRSGTRIFQTVDLDDGSSGFPEVGPPTPCPAAAARRCSPGMAPPCIRDAGPLFAMACRRPSSRG